MDISFFFQSIDDPYLHYPRGTQRVGNQIMAYTDEFPDWEEADIILIGCDVQDLAIEPDEDLDDNIPAPDVIRAGLYPLIAPTIKLKVVDVGNLNFKETLEETCEALAYVCHQFFKLNKVVILMGGGQYLTYGLFLAFEKLETEIDYVTIDHSPDIFDSMEGLTRNSFNHRILTHSPNYLKNFSVLGGQSFTVTDVEREALKRLHFSFVRVGELHHQIRTAEPYLRTAHLVSFDLSSIRPADAPGVSVPSYAGFTTEEACQLARFAGMGYNTVAFAICELFPAADNRGQTARLAALLIWHFIEAYYHKIEDAPKADRSNLQRYRISLNGPIKEIVFYKHERTERWWMEVPLPLIAQGNKGAKNILIPCAQADYEFALKDEIPERWWLAHTRPY